MKNIDNNDATIRVTVSTWVEEGLQTLSPINPITSHINDLFPKAEWKLLDFALEVYQNLIYIVKELGEVAQPLLVIPLRPLNNRLNLAVPIDLVNLMEQIDEYEPPSLYLMDWTAHRSIALCEEYRTPLPFSLLKEQYSTYTYYREYRYEVALKNNWEFSRAVYLEYYPNGLLNQ